jgi:outer membrane receptor for monomeric catechols
MFPSLSSSFQRVSEREEKTSVCLFCIDQRDERNEIENNSYLKGGNLRVKGVS